MADEIIPALAGDMNAPLATKLAELAEVEERPKEIEAKLMAGYQSDE